MWGVGVGIATLAFYAATACPTIYTSGAGENATAVLTLGVPHPPGFPLFCLAGKLFTLLLPLGTAAWRVNMFAAACGAAAAGVLYACARLAMPGAARPACAAGALLFAASRTFWSQAVIAEVYTCNALLQLLALAAALRFTRGGPLWPLGLACGLGVTVHPLSVLFAPAWLGVLVTARQRLTAPAVLRAMAVAGAATTLLLYGPIRSRADPVLDWGDPESWRGFIDYITAAQYRGRMFGVSGTEAAGNAWRAASQLASEMTPWLLPLPLLGAVLLVRGARGLLLGTGLAAAVTFVYAVNYDIPWEIEVYFIPVVLVMALWGTAALAWAAGRMGRAAMALPCVALLPLLANYRENDRSAHHIVEAYGRDILASAPRDATIVAPETDATFALLYLTAALGERPDVRVWVHTVEGAKPLARALAPSVPPIALDRLVAEAPGPVVLCDPPPPRSGLRITLAPHGIVERVVRPGEPPAAAFDFSTCALEAVLQSGVPYHLDDRSRVILARYHFARGDAHRLAGRAAEARADYDAAVARAPEEAETYVALAGRHEAMGDLEAAIRAVTRSLALREDAYVTNRLGRMLIDAGRRDEAMRALRRALELDPDLAIAHSNLGGLLGMSGDGAGAVRELETAVRLEPRNVMALKNLGQAYLMLGDRPRAVATWKRALALDPAQRELAALLASIEDRR